MISVQRRLNSTGRVRLTRESIHVELEQPADAMAFPWISARIDLKEFDFPGDAVVSLEAYYRSSSMRFPCGTVGEQIIPTRMILSDIDRGGAIKFRLLVIASDGSGRILGAAEGLRPATKGESRDRQPLLTMRETNLGNELWRIEVDSRTGPILCVNSAVSGLAAQIRESPLLQGLVLPHAFRIILEELGSEGEEDEDDYWGEDWRKFLVEIGVTEEPDESDPDVVTDWIESAVETFCNLKNFVSRIRLDPRNLGPSDV
jgi:hypothetical protein